MAKLMFYKKPVPLNKNNHKGLKLVEEANRFEFANDTNSVVLAGIEFAEAAKEYPIAFANIGGDRVAPVALLGFRDKENLFIAENNRWDARYIPAFIRRYPFVLAETGEQGNLSVCIDEAYEGLQETEGKALFEDDSSNAPLLDGILKFLNEYQQQYQRTETFINTLQELDLLSPLQAAVKLDDDNQLGLQQLLVVDEKKLLALDDDKALKLLRSGELGWIYSHLLSLSNLGALAQRTQDKQQTTIH